MKKAKKRTLAASEARKQQGDKKIKFSNPQAVTESNSEASDTSTESESPVSAIFTKNYFHWCITRREASYIVFLT